MTKLLKEMGLNYAYLNWWLEKPLSIVRLLGLIALAFGALLIYSA